MITLLVDGENYTGWEQVVFSRSLDYICGSFSLEVSKRSNDLPKINIGSECRLLLDGYTLFTGYIFEVNDTVSANDHNVAYTGRDKTADLIDCTHEGLQRIDRRVTAVEAIRTICDPFGIKVVNGLDVGNSRKTLTSWYNELSTRCGDLIARICRLFSFLVYTDTDGNLVLTKSGYGGDAVDKLDTRTNVKECSIIGNDSDRHSDIYYRDFFRASQQGRLDLGSSVATVKDAIVQRYRPLTLQGTDKGVNIDLQSYAEWEQRVRAGKSRSCVCQLASWAQSDGTPWALNTFVEVASPEQNVPGDGGALLISSISGSFSSKDGTSLSLTLVPAATYDLGIPVRFDLASMYDFFLLQNQAQNRPTGPTQ